MEQIYTIPVNEAFEASAADAGCGCPLCTLYTRLQENELELILGASMMEPDVRQKTNLQGFCRRHYGMMFQRKNRLGLGLMLESHLAEVEKMLGEEGLLALLSGPGSGTQKKLGQLEESCYICGRIEMHFSRMCETVLLLYREDAVFREQKFAAQPFFCLPHYRRLLSCGRSMLGKKEFPGFFRAAGEVMRRYAASLSEDVSWFCKKFDYRYQEEPWYRAKDAVERAIRFVAGDDGYTAGSAKGEKK